VYPPSVWSSGLLKLVEPMGSGLPSIALVPKHQRKARKKARNRLASKIILVEKKNEKNEK